MAADDLTPSRGLTPAGIDRLRPREKDYEVKDVRAPGLRLRVLASGRKVFRWVYWAELDGRREQGVVTYGPWNLTELAGHVTLEQARDRHEEARKRLEAGTLETYKRELKQRLRLRGERRVEPGGDSELVRVLAETFYRLRIVPHRGADGAKNIRAALDNDIVPAIGHLPVKTVTPIDCRGVLERVLARGAQTQAVTVHRSMTQFFGWVQGYGIPLPLGNPSEQLDRMALGIVEAKPHRWLTDDELPLFWAALDAERGYFPELRAALRIVLLTGVRPGELSRAEWPHVDLARGLWTVPPQHRKNFWRFKNTATPLGPWYVPLAPRVVELFEELRRSPRANGRAVVPSNGGRRGGRPTPTGRIARGRLADAMAEIMERHPLPGGEGGYDVPTPHDLRKTCRTHLDKLGCPWQVGERCLDHSLGSTAQRYMLNDALDERRKYLELWAEKVHALCAPEKTNVAFLTTTKRRPA